MALTVTQKRILNDASKYIPALKRGQLASSDAINLGDLIEVLRIDTLASVATVAVATADAAVTAAANGTDLGTTETLANDLKAKWNAAVTLINEQKTVINTLVTLVNEIRTNINAAA